MEMLNTDAENTGIFNRAKLNGSVTLASEEAREMADFITRLPGVEECNVGWRHYGWEAWFNRDDPGFVTLFVKKRTVLESMIYESLLDSNQNWSNSARDYDRLDQLGW